MSLTDTYQLSNGVKIPIVGHRQHLGMLLEAVSEALRQDTVTSTGCCLWK